ncbi:predicted protein [Lichtheimia corymbifera JMRC:FSU:9682]|uniref:Uncharacterized protein n=1 Tax=Lichtheimia corymbifera JMRC:FSU:9682 TaxID=1263082 RepID=A0A068RH02_9FUNG|nr:predicted protein [Lichtheimia corymbifera JMRC:FSU:9682]
MTSTTTTTTTAAAAAAAPTEKRRTHRRFYCFYCKRYINDRISYISKKAHQKVCATWERPRHQPQVKIPTAGKVADEVWLYMITSLSPWHLTTYAIHSVPIETISILSIP